VRRLAFGLLAVLSCAPASGPAAISLAPIVAPAEQTSGTLLEECRIVGTGERRASWRAPAFEVFASHGAAEPALVVALPGEAHVTWSAFPSMPSDTARARVELGGQRHLRFTGWAPLAGRTFSTRRRMVTGHGHLWARAGAAIELLAASGGFATARVASPFVAPKSFVVTGRCDTLAYEPSEPEHASHHEPKSTHSVFNRNASLDLHEAPSGAPFATLTFDYARAFELAVVEERGSFVRVTGAEGDVAFDAWVPAAETALDWGVGSIHTSGWGTSSCGGYYSSNRGVVARDTPLFVGAKPEALAGAVVEKSADVRYYPWDAKTVSGVALVPFDFADGMLRAPTRMWIARDAIQ